MRSKVASGVGYGAIGGAASAALSPDLLKAIDPTGATLSPGQQAAMEGFATLLGGGLAGLAGANAQGGANAALNEVMNNTDDHPETAAKNGGVLGAVGDWLKNTYGDPIGSVENWLGQFGGLVQSGAQQTSSQSPAALAAQGVANGVTAVSGAGGGLPPTAGPDSAPVGPGIGSGQMTPPAAGGTPPNATLSNGDSGDDSGSATTGQGSASGTNDPSTPTGQAGSPMTVKPGTNLPSTIGDISYSGHALDEMQSDGIVPSAVQNAIQNGTQVSGKNPGTVVYYDATNNITVVTSSSSGKVVTVSYGKIRQ